MRLWRLAAADIAERFDGGYGVRNAGRWNQRGQIVTYCASVPSLCVLEKLVHIEDVDLFPNDLRLVRYEAPDDLAVSAFEPGNPLEEGWEDRASLTQTLGAEWYEARETALLRVPSVIVPTIETADRNFVINHSHPDIGRIVRKEDRAFRLDPRLLSYATRPSGRFDT